MLQIILVLFALAMLSPVLCRWRFPGLGWLLALVPAIIFLLFCAQISTIATGNTLSEQIAWLPAANINLNFYLDGLSLLFCLLITGIGTLITLYSYSYLKDNPGLGRYFAFLFTFMAAMLGTVLANNLIELFIFWELTSISSYLLISFNHNNKAARRAALQGLLVTAGGGLALLLGLIMIGSISNHYSINWLLNNPEVIRSSNFYIAIVIFVLLGAFTKSAQYPFHFWLPKAMQAPTPVSAYLHSATMVKLGVYLVARFTPLLGHTLPWESLLIVFGGITMLSATVLMLRATDLKQLLAYSTIMALGTLMFMLASGSQPEVEAAMVFLFAHALYKACLFLNAGAIDKATGTRELPNLRGLRKAMPITFISTILAALSLAGWPPVIGFISKEMIYVAKLDSSLAAFIMLAVAFITNVGFVCLAYILVVKPFFGKAVSYPGRSTVKEVSFNLFICPLTLAALGLIFGLHPWLVDSSIISPAVSSILNKPISTEITLWHGLTPAFRLSVATSLVALLVYLAYKPINNFLKTSALLTIFSPEKIYEQFLIFLNRFASQTTQIIQPGSLRMYTSALFIVLGALTCFTFFHFKHIAPSTVLPNAPWFTWIIAIVMLAAAYTAITVSSYLVCLVLLGIIGIGSTLIFLLYSAPDVAMTQLLIDVLTIVMIVLALYRLPSLPPYEGTQKRSAYFNLFIALFVGLTITAILLSVVSVPFNYAITNFYDNNSLIAAHGRNIVNVILVDFRAFDTLGEILVVAIAGLGVYGLLNFAKKKKEAK